MYRSRPVECPKEILKHNHSYTAQHMKKNVIIFPTVHWTYIFFIILTLTFDHVTWISIYREHSLSRGIPYTKFDDFQAKGSKDTI